VCERGGEGGGGVGMIEMDRGRGVCGELGGVEGLVYGRDTTWMDGGFD